jgi:DNA-binding transcriptional regulator YdaS (Cro superfamily)
MSLTRDQALKMLKKAIREAGGQKEFARQHGISQTIISTTMTGKRGMSPTVLDAIGLEPAESYQRKAL